MSSDEHRIMDVVAEDAPDKASPEYIEDMLKELRQFVNEHASNPSQRNFNDWSENYWDRTYKLSFGSWNNAVEAVGGEPNETADYDWDEVDQKLNRLIEEEVRHGSYIVAGPGEVPPVQYINDVWDGPADVTLVKRYGPRENWPEEVCSEKERNANDVNVDPTDFGL